MGNWQIAPLSRGGEAQPEAPLGDRLRKTHAIDGSNFDFFLGARACAPSPGLTLAIDLLPKSVSLIRREGCNSCPAEKVTADDLALIRYSNRAVDALDRREHDQAFAALGWSRSRGRGARWRALHRRYHRGGHKPRHGRTSRRRAAPARQIADGGGLEHRARAAGNNIHNESRREDGLQPRLEGAFQRSQSARPRRDRRRRPRAGRQARTRRDGGGGWIAADAKDADPGKRATRDTAPPRLPARPRTKRSSAPGYVLPATHARGPAEGSHHGKKPCFRVSAAA